MNPCTNFIELAEALNSSSVGQTVHAVGIVDRFLPAAPTKGSAYMMSLTLRDSSLGPSQFIDLKLFRSRADLPSIDETGSVVLAKGCKIDSWRDKILLGTLPSTQIFIFPKSVLSRYPNLKQWKAQALKQDYSRSPPNATDITSEDLSRIHAIFQWHRSEPSLPQPYALRSFATRRERFSKLKDVDVEMYADIVVDVVKVDRSSERALLYVTDYTKNSKFHNFALSGSQNSNFSFDSDEADYQACVGHQDREAHFYSVPNWTGPEGHITMLLLVEPPTARWVLRNVSPEQVIFCKNVYFRTYGGILEGVLREDKRYPDKILCHHLSDSDSLASERDQVLHRRKGHRVQMARNELARKKKSKKRASDPESPTLGAKKVHTEATSESSYALSTRSARNRLEAAAKPSPFVKCGNHTYPIFSLSSVLRHPSRLFFDAAGSLRQVPFLNIKYRSRVRVVDYDPPDLRDFCHSLADPDYNPPVHHTQFEWEDSDPGSQQSGDDDQDSADDDPSFTQAGAEGAERWEWAFRLLVEDPATTGSGPNPKRDADVIGLKPGTASMEVIVSGAEALYMLGLDPTNLRKDPATLNKLRQRLFYLWGNLEELKTASREGGQPDAPIKKSTISSLPFDCCIMEYGVEVKPKQWARCHKLFATKISAETAQDDY